jgi:hypothetical protein
MMVRDNFRCWVPAGQFWIEKEHNDFYIEAFQLLQEWTNGMWNPNISNHSGLWSLVANGVYTHGKVYHYLEKLLPLTLVNLIIPWFGYVQSLLCLYLIVLVKSSH